MKKAKWKDFQREIKKSLNRFLSILFIAALGVAFFAGVRSSEPDMRLSVDTFLDKSDFMDIRIIGTMGLTEDDVKAVEAVEGITYAEGAYESDFISHINGEDRILHVTSLLSGINRLYIEEGRLPQKPGECFADAALVKNFGLSLGDTITVTDDSEGGWQDTLEENTFTIVGVGTNPYYLTWDRGTSNTGSGKVDAFLVVLPEDFVQGIYTQIYAAADGLDELGCYDDEYNAAVDILQEKIEEIADGRCQIRLEEIKKEPLRELEDARTELEEAREEADKRLSDAWNEIIDGEKQIADGQKEIDEGYTKLEDARTQLEQNKQELSVGIKELEEKAEELFTGKRELEEGYAKLFSERAVLEEKEKELSAGRDRLEEKQKELNESEEKIKAVWKEIQEGKELLAAKKEELSAGKTALLQAKEQYEAGRAELEAKQKELEETKVILEKKAEELSAGWNQYEEELQKLEQSRHRLQEQEEVLRQQIDALTAMGIDPDMVPEIVAAREQIAQGIQQTEAGQVKLDAVKAQLENAEAELNAGKQQMEDGEQAVNNAKAALNQVAKEIETNEAVLAQGSVQIEEQEAVLIKEEKRLGSADKEITEGRTQLDTAMRQVENGENQLKEGFEKIEEGQAQLDSLKAVLEDGEVQSEAARRKLEEESRKLNEAEKLIGENVEELEEAGKRLEDSKALLSDAKNDYAKAKEDAEAELSDARRKIEDGQTELDELYQPFWYVLDRNTIQTYVEYGQDAERIGAIGKVFPAIFFFVAALVCLTTMTRMVEEQRVQIGTFKALGYSNGSIAGKYLLYALLASLTGGVVGALVGGKVFPMVIIKAYGILYDNIRVCAIPIHAGYSIMSILIAIVCTTAAALAACYKELLSEPAALMRPAAPKQGKRILLERIPFLWSRMNFSQKSTVRNLFRYKKRLFMTVFGIGACMALLLVGFGLRDAISAIVGNQYEKIRTYQAELTLDMGKADDGEEKWAALAELLAKEENITNTLNVLQTAMDAQSGDTVKSVYLFVPEQVQDFPEFVSLQDRKTGEKYVLDDEHVIISEKLASLLELKVGDTFELKEDDTRRYTVTVGAIAENYVYHYVYMTPILYEKVFEEQPEYDCCLVKLEDKSSSGEKALTENLLRADEVTKVNLISDTHEKMGQMMGSLDAVVWVLIISAGLLAFVVLYNLNNINITERRRELATLKVLGFYDVEVAGYVYRENILLTIIGIGAGVIMGKYLHRFVILTAEIDMIMFGRDITGVSYGISILMTVLFSALVNAAMYFHLKKIDMIESLKSVE